jgi:hypothetical protein
VVKVTAADSKRISLAALIATKPGITGRARLIYGTHVDRGQGKHCRKGFAETDYARLLDAAHQQLHGPIVLVWDNLPTHTSRADPSVTSTIEGLFYMRQMSKYIPG